MANLNYQRSANKERDLAYSLEKNGYFSVRSAGSHGPADVIGIRPTDCGVPSHFEVVFYQIKVSEKFKDLKEEPKVVDSPCGPLNINFVYFPVRGRKSKTK